VVGEMSTPEPKPIRSKSLELPVEELLRRAKPHPPYGEDVINDLTPEEAEAFLEDVSSSGAASHHRDEKRRLDAVTALAAEAQDLGLY
jgi:hypothetical protein